MGFIPLDIWRHHIVPLLEIDELLALTLVSKIHGALTENYWQPRLDEFEQRVTARYAKYPEIVPTARFEVRIISTSHAARFGQVNVINTVGSYAPYMKALRSFAPVRIDMPDLSAKQLMLAFLFSFRCKSNTDVKESLRFLAYHIVAPFLCLFLIGSFVGFNIIEGANALINLVAMAISAYRSFDCDDQVNSRMAAGRYMKAMRGHILLMVAIVAFGFSGYSLVITLLWLTAGYNMMFRDDHTSSFLFAAAESKKGELDLWRKSWVHFRKIVHRIRNPITWTLLERNILPAEQPRCCPDWRLDLPGLRHNMVDGPVYYQGDHPVLNVNPNPLPIPYHPYPIL